jgi:hypothetical protein
MRIHANSCEFTRHRATSCDIVRSLATVDYSNCIVQFLYSDSIQIDNLNEPVLKKKLGNLRTSRQNRFSAGPLSSFCSEGLSKDCTMQYEPSPNVTRCHMMSREFA